MMKTHIGINAVWVLAMLLTAISPAHGKNYINQIQNQIQDQLHISSQIKYDHCEPCIQKTSQGVWEFYSNRNFTPAWINAIGLKPEAALLMDAIQNAGEEGLPIEAYPINYINRLKKSILSDSTEEEIRSPHLAAQLDIALTTAFFLHSSYLTGGRLESDYFQDIQILTDASIRHSNDLELALATHTLDLLLTKLPPPHKKYIKLLEAQKRYERIVAADGWPEIPSGPVLKKGKHDERILLLRERLMLSGDLLEPLKKDLNYFDEDIEKAVQNFQRRHDLYADGIIGPSTLKELNISAKERLLQIQVNLERWRALPRNLGNRYIEVNIPDFNLEIVEEEKIAQSMRVVVGRRNRPTPILSGKITYLEINPYWTVPPQIAKKDILPKVQVDPTYLIRQNIRVFENWQASAAELDPRNIDWSQLGEKFFPYKLRQEPNDQNALGKVKFMFPNKLSIYLHDTPSKDLFNRQQRSFSSGCVRVEKPLDLAAYLLGNETGWNKRNLARLLDKGSSTVLSLKNPIPVYLLYWTAWVEDDGQLQFRNDIYGRDQALAHMLEKQLPDLVTCQNHLISEHMVISHNDNTSAISDNHIGQEAITEEAGRNQPLAVLSKE